MHFEIAGEITHVEVIARGRGIRALRALRKRYGGQRWRKMKGIAAVRLFDASRAMAELHWYEAHGVGRVGWKIKRFLDEDYEA
jgi:hypothetical protein